jgi:hypothetical protein
MTESLVLNVLRQAIRGLKPVGGLINPSDRSDQDAGMAYREC